MDDLLKRLRDYGADVDGAMERFMDDKQLYADCLQVFKEDPGFDELDAALGRADYRSAFNYAHMLKGVAANMGLAPMTAALSGIVEPLREHRCDNLDRVYKAVLSERQRMRAL